MNFKASVILEALKGSLAREPVERFLGRPGQGVSAGDAVEASPAPGP